MSKRLGLVFETPRGAIFQYPNGQAKLVWRPGFAPRVNRRYSAAQRNLDSEVLALSEPYIPLRTGMLIKTGILGTEIGTGLVQWIAPYSRRQYYSKRQPGSATGPLRGPYWFERMKATWGGLIIANAKRWAGGR